MPRPYTGALSPKEACRGISLMLINARRLSDLATALLDTDPRLADFLSSAALEELAKAHTLHTDVVHGSPADWKGLWRRLRNHKEKLIQALYGDMPDLPGALTIHDLGVDETVLWNKYRYDREGALYVDLWEEDGQRFWAVPQPSDRQRERRAIAQLLDAVAIALRLLAEQVKDHLVDSSIRP